MVALANVRYFWHWTIAIGSIALNISRFCFFLLCLALSAHCSQQYFWLPDCGVNSLPQWAKFWFYSLLTMIWDLYFVTYLHRKSLQVNRCQLMTTPCTMLQSASTCSRFVNHCKRSSSRVNRLHKVTKIKLWRFSAVEIRCKNRRKIRNQQTWTLKC